MIEDASPEGEELSRHQRLRRSVDFSRCYRLGEKKHRGLLSIHSYPKETGPVRLGVTVSRRVGNSVVRHRLKRRVREVFRRSKSRSNIVALDLVVHLKVGSAVATFRMLADELETLLSSLQQTMKPVS